MPMSGRRPDAVQRLDHKDIETTLNVCGHLLPEPREELTDRRDTIYRAGM
jgi:hypothetical protein